MWSTEHRGGVASVLNAQQRVLFPVEAGASDTTARQLTRALLAGSCAGVALLAPDDERACRVVRAALHDACDRNPLLSRAHFAVVVETSAHWAADELLERAERLLEHLQLETLDLLLLRMQTLALPSEPDVYETKRAVLRLWAAALELQQRGRVAHLGVSDFSIQLTEFILTAHPCDPPVALALVLSLEPPLSPAAAANGTEAKTGGDTRLASAVAFAHGRGVDVIVRFPVRALDALSPAVRDRWSRLVHTIAHKHRGQRFEVVVAHEAGREPHPTQTQTQTQTMADTPALQSAVQIATRYLLQSGLVVIPTTTQSSAVEDAVPPFDDDECRELFDTLAHPFTALAPSYSANRLYSSVLSRDDLEAVGLALPLLVLPSGSRPLSAHQS